MMLVYFSDNCDDDNDEDEDEDVYRSVNKFFISDIGEICEVLFFVG